MRSYETQRCSISSARTHRIRRLGLIAAILLFLIPAFGQQIEKSASAALVQDFRQASVFYRQLEIGQKIVALRDPSVLDSLADLLSSEDRHVRGNAAFVYAGLGDVRGLRIIEEIIQDKSYRIKGQG